jgi:hypothetical protein
LSDMLMRSMSLLACDATTSSLRCRAVNISMLDSDDWIVAS